MAGYRPLEAGLKALGQSDWMKGATLETARTMAGKANAVGDSSYEAKSRTVRAGWGNEPRAGAVVGETVRDWRDSRDAVLLRVAASMTIRGRR